MKVETIEEFLARGGKVTIVPKQEAPIYTQPLPIRSNIDHGSLSLGSIYAVQLEEKSAPKEKKTGLTSLLETSWLPREVKISILENVRIYKEQAIEA